MSPRLKIGLQLPQIEGLRGPGSSRWSDLAAMARVAEDIGLDSLWISDHDASADPWWDRLPSESLVGAGPLIPLNGPPEEIAETFRAYQKRGVSQLQICLEPTNEHTIAALAPLLEQLAAG